MSDIRKLLVIGAILCVVVGCIVYTVWIVFSIFKRKWRLVRLQIGIPAMLFVCLAGAGAWLTARDRTEYMAAVYDAEADTGRALFKYDSSRAWNTDGYSFAVYSLPDTVRRRFESADKRLLTQYPKPPDSWRDWHSEHWREAPFDNSLREYLDSALSVGEIGNAPGLYAEFHAARKALERKGVYYAFFYRKYSDRVRDIDFFIVDLVERRIYLINLGDPHLQHRRFGRPVSRV